MEPTNAGRVGAAAPIAATVSAAITTALDIVKTVVKTKTTSSTIRFLQRGVRARLAHSIAMDEAAA